MFAQDTEWQKSAMSHDNVLRPDSCASCSYSSWKLSEEHVIRATAAAFVTLKRGGLRPVNLMAQRLASRCSRIPGSLQHGPHHAPGQRMDGAMHMRPQAGGACSSHASSSSCGPHAGSAWHSQRLPCHVNSAHGASCSFSPASGMPWATRLGTRAYSSQSIAHGSLRLASSPIATPLRTAWRTFSSVACKPAAAAGAAAGRGAAAAGGAAAKHVRQLQWQATQDYMRQMNQQLYKSISPYLSQAVPWASFQTLARTCMSWLPSMPGTRHAYLDMLNALNIVGKGGALLRTLAFTVVELVRTNVAHAQAPFEYYVHVPPTSVPSRPWYIEFTAQAADSIVALARMLWLLLVFAPVVLTSPLALQWNIYRAEWMELLRRTLEAAGPAFIKWGQWAATRHDVFPPDMCAELELLHSQAPAHKFKHTVRAIKEAFGLDHSELFTHIEPQPVASGSIGQIHIATLSDKGARMTGFESGQQVAVKVRHPGVATTILRDFATMMWVAHLASKLESVAHLRLEDTLKQFAAPLKEQVDLAREASNLQRFNFNFRHTNSVQFPVPLYPLVASEVLVETFEDGDHITRYIQNEGNPHNPKLSILGAGLMLQMMLVDNLIHSDLHPGNILVRLQPPGGAVGLMYGALDALKRSSHVSNTIRARIDNLQQSWLQPQIVLLDVGMATEMSDDDQKNMVGLFRGFAGLDGRDCGEWVLRFSGDQQQCPDPEAFKSDMAATFAEMKRMDELREAAAAEGGLDVGAAWSATQFRDSAETLAHVLELVRVHQVTLPGHICAVVVTTLVLESWSNKLDPNHSVLTQVEKMFEAESVPWTQRISNLVDDVCTAQGEDMPQLPLQEE